MRWSGDAWYAGVVDSYNAETRQHRVRYDEDGDVRLYNMRQKTCDTHTIAHPPTPRVHTRTCLRQRATTHRRSSRACHRFCVPSWPRFQVVGRTRRSGGGRGAGRDGRADHGGSKASAAGARSAGAGSGTSSSDSSRRRGAAASTSDSSSRARRGGTSTAGSRGARDGRAGRTSASTRGRVDGASTRHSAATAGSAGRSSRGRARAAGTSTRVRPGRTGADRGSRR